MSTLLVGRRLSRGLYRPWKNCTTVGRAYDALRADVQQHLDYLQREIGFSYIRFHALFHEDMGVVKRAEDGSIYYQWHHIDKLYDSLLEKGLRPFVELNPMPQALATGSQTMFHYRMNVTPPADYGEWNELVFAFATHCVERYGLAEVEAWYFEVWNEPNLKGFWSGTQDEYFRLYDEAAAALKKVSPSLRVGGPATAAAGWITEFLEHCSTRNVPVDFVSTHLYPMDEPIRYGSVAASPHEPGEFFAAGVRRVRELVRSSPFPDLEIHWTEWNAQTAADRDSVTFLDNPYVDTLYGAGFVARECIALDAECESLAYWAATDVFEEHPIPGAPFSCTYGLVSVHGIPKATANAFRLMARLDGPLLDLSTSPATDADAWGCGAVAVLHGPSLRVLLYNHLFATMPAREPWRVDVRLTDLRDIGLSPGEYVMTSLHVRKGAGSAREIWEAIGSPNSLTPTQLAALRQAAEPEAQMARMVLREDGVIAAGEHPDDPLRMTVASHELYYFEITPADAPAPPKSRVSNIAKLEHELGESPN